MKCENTAAEERFLVLDRENALSQAKNSSGFPQMDPLRQAAQREVKG